jgi:hypothetical protein
MRKLAPGEVVALALVAEALIADVVLIRKGHDPISTAVRRNPHARRMVRWLSAHLCDDIPLDVLTWLGGRVTRRVVDAVTP